MGKMLRYQDRRAHLNKKVRFRAFVAPSTSFLASIAASATFSHKTWRTRSQNHHFFKAIGTSTWDVVCWGGRRHDQGLFFD